MENNQKANVQMSLVEEYLDFVKRRTRSSIPRLDECNGWELRKGANVIF